MREYLLVTLLLCFNIEIRPYPIGLAVILQLEGISADKYLGRTNENVEYLLISLHEIEIHRIRRIAGHDEKHGNSVLITAGRFGVVCQILKDEPLVECSEGCRHLTEVIGRAYYQTVRFSDCVKHGRKSVLYYAMPFILLFLATETGSASGILLHPEEIESLHGRTFGFRTF